MSDFFTRLATRALGLAPTLQPLIAPIFAQEQSLWQTDIGLLESLTEEETLLRAGDVTRQDGRGRQRHSASPSISIPSSEHSSASLPFIEAPNERGQENGHQDERPAPSSILSANQQPASMLGFSESEAFQEQSTPSAAREAPVVHEEMTGSTLIQSQKEPLNTGGTDERHFPERRTARPLPLIKRNNVIAEVDMQSTSTLATASAAPTSVMQQDNESPVHKHTVADGMETRALPDKGRRASGDGRTTFAPPVINRIPVQRNAGMAREQKQPVQQVPSIQVTIGRVEVRATPPPAPPAPARQAPTPTVRSLDDYLRQREEGRVR